MIMSMDFYSAKGGSFHFSWSDWHTIFALAEMYGWNPVGTQPATFEGERQKGDPSQLWTGGYMSNDFQVVTAEDALAMSTALEAAIKDLPDRDLRPVTREMVPFRDGHVKEMEFLTDGSEDDPKLFWSGSKHKAYVQKFVDFCKCGQFSIC